MDASPLPKRRKKGALPPWVVVLTLAIVLGGAGGTWYYLNQPKNGVRLNALSAEAKSKLPPGTPKEEAMSWLQSKGYSNISDMRDLGGKLTGYNASIRNDTPLEKSALEITCNLDDAGKVTSVYVGKVKVWE